MSASLYPDITIKSYTLDSVQDTRSEVHSVPHYDSSQIVASSEDNSISVLGLWFINSGETSSGGDVSIYRLVFNDFMFGNNAGLVGIANIDLMPQAEPAVVKDPLVFPNPFKFSQGATLGYALSTNMDINLQIYNMFGHKMYDKTFMAGTMGGQATVPQQIALNSEAFNGTQLSAGVYFYVLLYKGSVVKKGKFAVIP